jgi:chemotaxis response regulator CheB
VVILVSVPRVDSKSEATIRAVTFIRVQLDTPDQRLNPMSDMMLEQALTSDEELAVLMSGMNNLVLRLLVKLEKATGATMSEILDDIAWRAQQ